MNPAPLHIPKSTGDDGFFQPKRAAFWLLIFFLSNGLFITTQLVLSGFRAVPTSTLLGLGAWTLYTLPIFWFFRRLKLFGYHPWTGFALAFAWGGLGAIYLALPANQAVFGLCAKLVSPEFSQKWGPAMAGPANEEPLKLIGVVLLVLIARNRFHSVTSVMALGAMVGLGFQVVEDLSYTVNGAINHSSPDQVLPVIQVFVVRGLFCGLWSHTAYTAIAAYGVGYFVVHHHESLRKRLGVAVGAVIAAWSLHFFWNSPLLAESLYHGPLIILFFLLKGGPVVLAAGLLWRTARREELAR